MWMECGKKWTRRKPKYSVSAEETEWNEHEEEFIENDYGKGREDNEEELTRYEEANEHTNGSWIEDANEHINADWINGEINCIKEGGEVHID